jgi:hypothetical protein
MNEVFKIRKIFFISISLLLLLLKIQCLKVGIDENFLKHEFSFLSTSAGDNEKKNILRKNHNFSSQNITNNHTEIEVFYDSMCKDSIQYFSQGLRSFYDYYSDFQKKINLVLIPGAFEHIASDIDTNNYIEDDKLKFQCKNGENECLGNKFHACALSTLDKSIAYNYIFCFMENIKIYTYNTYSTTQFCATKNNFQYDDLLKCVNSKNSNTYMRLQLEKKQKLSEVIRETPWITINNKYDFKQMENLIDNFTSEICKVINYDSEVQICHSYDKFGIVIRKKVNDS